MKYINSISVSTISTNEILPIGITIEDLDSTLLNTIVSAKRYDMSDSEDTGTDISSIVNINYNKVTITKLFLDTETPTDGLYRVNIITENPQHTIKIEFNVSQIVE